MDKTTLTQSLPRKGGICTVSTVRPCKTRKGFDGTLEKRSVFQLRAGHNYYNQQATRSAHESGERAIADPADLWHKPEGSHPALRAHKGTGAVYLAGQPTGNPARSQYVLDGNPVEFEQVESILLASEKREKSNSDWVMLSIESIVSIA